MLVRVRAKSNVGRKLNSSATVGEAGQNIRLRLDRAARWPARNALAGWWWADPTAALVIGAVAAREGVESWRGKSCDCC